MVCEQIPYAQEQGINPGTYQGIKSGHQGKVATASGNPRDLDFLARSLSGDKTGMGRASTENEDGRVLCRC